MRSTALSRNHTWSHGLRELTHTIWNSICKDRPLSVVSSQVGMESTVTQWQHHFTSVPKPKPSKRIQTLRISLKQGKFPCSWCYRLKSPSCRIYLTIDVKFRQVSQVGSRFSSLRFCRFGWCMANAPLSERQDARDASLVGASERRERMSCLDFLKHRPPF